MTATTPVPSSQLVEHGATLYAAELDETLSVLGIQAEALEINLDRNASGRPVSEWSDNTAFDRVLSSQRAPSSELARYARRGADFAQELLDQLGQDLRHALCVGNQVRKELLAFEDNIKEGMKYMVGILAGMLTSHLPAAVAAAAVAIATTVAVIVLKNNLHKFCLTSSLELKE